MARIRTIKPSYWSDAKVCKLSLEAQLLFIGLWNFADCDGLLWDDPDQIQMDVFPSRPHVKLPSLIEELLLTGLLQSVVTSIGRDALRITNFGKHQRIKNESASIITPLIVSVSGQIRMETDEGEDVPQEGKGLGSGSKASPRAATPSATASVQALVSYYVDECKQHGYDPLPNWKNQLGNQTKRILGNKDPDLIRSAIRVMAAEHKVPGVLAAVIVDLEAGRNGNGKP
jgi:hypothetical protein